MFRKVRHIVHCCHKKNSWLGRFNLDDSRKKINKFKESAWNFVYFLSGEVLSLSVTYNEPWFKNTRYFWVGPGDQIWPDQKIK